MIYSKNRTAFVAAAAALLSIGAAPRKRPVPVILAWPPTSNYRIEYLESIASPDDLGIHPSLFSRLGAVLVGASERPRKLMRPFTLASDPSGRLLVTDPGEAAVHVFDPGRNTDKILSGPGKDPLKSPVGLDFDAAGNIYVADSLLGKIYVFGKDGRFLRFIGDLKGEGYFKRPTGLAIDRATGRIYLTDTLRHKVYALDSSGRIEREWGRRGEGAGEFNFPIAVAVGGGQVFVLDSGNFRVQVFTPSGDYISSFGKPVNEPGGFFRPKALAVDEKNRLVYVTDAMFQVVQAFSFDGSLVMAFGQPGANPGEFRLPAGLCLQPGGRILVADSYNRRIQVFQTVVPQAGASGNSR